MKAVYKYPLGRLLVNYTSVELPLNAKILKVAEQEDKICLWCEVDLETAALERRRFTILGTGDQFNDISLKYLDTVFVGQFVWHVYEVR